MTTLIGRSTLSWSASFPMALSGTPTGTIQGDIPRETFATSSQTDRVGQSLHGIQEAYAMLHPGEVFRFLRQHPSLAEIVWEAAHVLRRIFGFDTRLSLEMLHDPETGEAELFALVHVNGPADEALLKLRTFDEAWFLDQQALVDGLFNVDVTFS